ncbi:sulfur carrier protein ThiS [Thalassotalea piscium]
MRIRINDEVLNIESNILMDILVQYGAKVPFAVAVNGEFVAKSHYANRQIAPGDSIDIVSPIFGG